MNSYRVVQLKDGTYAVEVTEPGKMPWTITTFQTEAEAEVYADGRRHADGLMDAAGRTAERGKWSGRR